MPFCKSQVFEKPLFDSLLMQSRGGRAFDSFCFSTGESVHSPDPSKSQLQSGLRLGFTILYLYFHKKHGSQWEK